MSTRIASTSTEPYEAVIVTDIDPTSNGVKAQLVTTGGDPPATDAGTWLVGTWKTATAVGDRYRTPAWFTITGQIAGTYDVWVWVDGSTYDPVLPAGTIVIY